MNTSGRKRWQRWRETLRDMRLAIGAFLALIVLAIFGILLLRTTLLKNAQSTGTTLSRSYAAEESNNLAVYETLLTFGTVTIDRVIEAGQGQEAVVQILDSYFERMNEVLGEGTVDPYVVMDGKILAANPWEGDATYDVSSTEWYQKAMEADGDVIFTDIYTDAIYHTPVITAAKKCAHTDAVAAFDIFLEHFQFETVDLAAGNSFFLCDSHGGIIYQETDLSIPEEEIQGYLNGLLERIGDGSLEKHYDYLKDIDGELRAAYYTRMENGWYSIITMPYRNIFRSLYWFSFAFALAIGIFLLAFVGMAWREVRLKTRMERADETVRALGNLYYALYRVNYVQETYEMIKGSDDIARRIPSSGPYSELLRAAGEVIEADTYREFTEHLSAENIQRLVKQKVRDFGGDFLRRFGDEYRWVSVRVLFDESLAPEEVVLSFREVEREKQRQLQERRLLENSLELAKQNEMAKQAFFSNMSHDMRTPLNAILGLSDLAGRNTGDAERVAGYLEKIKSASRYLLGLINDILDMSRMEQGKMILDNRQFDLRACVEECLENFRPQAEKDGKQLKTEFQMADVHLMGDSFRLQQILNNLLSNAFKYTPAGGTISLSVDQIARGEYVKYKFVVADTGIGMSKEFLERLFEPYSREMRFSDKQAAGTGLGMSITKSLVLQMNGEIHVESEPGKGSVFTLVLPFMACEERKNPAAADKPSGQLEASGEGAFSLEGRRILLAEDNEMNMEILTEILSSQGIHVAQAWNGAEAVERFEESLPFEVDAVLMDMQMPEMDGCEAAKRIRALSRPDAKTVPIIAVTANAFAEDIAATIAAGMDAHISKPIDFELLREMLADLICRRPRPGQ